MSGTRRVVRCRLPTLSETSSETLSEHLARCVPMQDQHSHCSKSAVWPSQTTRCTVARTVPSLPCLMFLWDRRCCRHCCRRFFGDISQLLCEVSNPFWLRYVRIHALLLAGVLRCCQMLLSKPVLSSLLLLMVMVASAAATGPTGLEPTTNDISNTTALTVASASFACAGKVCHPVSYASGVD